MNKIAREVLLALSAIGTLVAGGGAAASVSGSLPAILFMLAGFGFAGVFIYYLIVRGAENNNSIKE